MKKIIAFLLILCTTNICEIKAQSNQSNESSEKKWWKEAVVYQIYPRSFKDSNGDGIGDLKGIISKIDYIKSLGVDVIWLNPIYQSPNDDNGYDISDYRKINPEFGTMADFDALLKGLHQKGIKLMMDVVVNHSSDEHDWFKKSRSSRNSPYRNYYHWWNAEKGKPPYRYSLFDINHDAWRYDSLTNAYYLHYFSAKQPDLNWENPKLRQEIYDMMTFWAKKGIDGFRLDAFQFASKDITYPEFGADLATNFIKYYAMGPHLHTYLKEMNAQVFSKFKVMTVAEGAGKNFEDAHNLVDAERHELNMAYAFDAVDLAKPKDFDLVNFKKVFTRWDSSFAKKGWFSVFLANHDQARLVSRFGNDSPEFRVVSAKMLNTFLLTMRGTPYCYFGDELGMTNIKFKSIVDYKDVPTKNEYQYQLNHGGDMKAFIESLKFGCRDNGRTPMQWNLAKNGGFSTATPWIKVNPDYKEINVNAEEKEATSTLNYFKKLTALRKKYKTFVYGKYQVLDIENPKVYAYVREDNEHKFLVLLNFSKENTAFKFNENVNNKMLILSNYNDTKITQKISLRPYEALILKMSKQSFY